MNISIRPIYIGLMNFKDYQSEKGKEF